MRGEARSEREALFVPGARMGKKKVTLRSLGDVFGGTSWWTYYDGVARQSIKRANPFWLYAALTAADPAERDHVVSTVAGIDATTYCASNAARRRTARAFGACEQRYLQQMPDALLDQYLACAAYPARRNGSAHCPRTSSSRFSARGTRGSGSRASSGRRTRKPAATSPGPAASTMPRSRRSGSDAAAAGRVSVLALDLVRRSRYKRDESAWIPTRCARVPMPSPLSASASTMPVS
jgi:hypothetical protein